ncbi:beta-propeller domain-containing protein [Nocardioides sp. YIM 152588]|uniref:beta-propeller domain-containing protein n=1 Tax=Nocardioides sp. YIM 152588 TaxID=3158259 RepID=UPI0032E44B48
MARHDGPVRRLLLTLAVPAVVGTTFLAGWWAGGGGGDGAATGHGDVRAEPSPSPVAFAADLAAAGSCDELLADYVARGLERVTAWGWQGWPLYAVPLELGDAGFRAAGVAGDVATKRQVSSETGTNVQEAGVDEPDTVKTDGEVLVRVRGGELVVHDVGGSGDPSGAAPEIGALRLTGFAEPELLLAGDTVVVVGRDRVAARPGVGTRVATVDLADPAHPETTAVTTYDAEVLSARQHGDAIRLVLSAGLPDLAFRHPRPGFGRRAALAANRRLVERSTLDDWLPQDTTTGSALLDCADVALAPAEVGLGTVAVVGFDAAEPTGVEAIGVAGAFDTAYESADHLYLAATPGWGGWDPCPVCGRASRPAVTDGTSRLLAFDLDGTRATHVASGEVEGEIRDRWSLDEAGGVLRVAVGATADTGDFSSIVTLRPSGGRLVEVGRLKRLGVGEEITAVRWSDDLALLVTFRRIDPLYAIDLSDVAAPRLLGALKIPGFSSYLHPLGPDRMIGVGEGPGPDRGWGAQVGLFDVDDLTRPQRVDVAHLGRSTNALAGTDPRAFTWVPEHRTAITVVERYRRTRVGLLVVMRLAEGGLHPETTLVERGADVRLVRAVPVGGGRVVLVTGEDVRFLDLA